MQNDHDRPPCGHVVDVNGLEAVLAFMSIEERQLLAAVDHVDHVVDVQGDGDGDCRTKAGAVLIDQGIGQPYDAPPIRRVLPARQRRLRAEVPTFLGQAATSELEGRIGTQETKVVAVLIAEGDGEDARLQDRRRGMSDKHRVAVIRYQSPKPVDYPDPTFRGSQQHDAAIGTDLPAIESGCDFLARDAWHIERKLGILVHGGCGLGGDRKRSGVATRIYSKSTHYAIPAASLRRRYE